MSTVRRRCTARSITETTPGTFRGVRTGRAVWCCIGWLLAVILSQSAVAENPTVAEEVHWKAEVRDLAFDGWRARLAIDSTGDGWLGGSLAESRSQDLLWRLEGGLLKPRALPHSVSRAYVLDLDSAGTLWVAAYDSAESATNDRLEVVRLPGATERTELTDTLGPTDWIVELVRPGLWPQAMAMVDSETGWIGGNHAKLLKRTPTGWRAAEIELEPGVESLDLNVLDIALTRDGHGLLVGSRGLVARLEGGVWRQLAVPEILAGRQLLALDLTPDGAAWIVGRGGVLARWHGDDGWHIERPATFTLMAIDMVNNEEGWAVGGAGTILRRHEGRWQSVPSPMAEDLVDIAMQDREHGWIVSQRTVLRGEPARSTLPWVESTPAMLADRPAQELAIADLNGDGSLDLILGEREDVRIFPRRAEGFSVGPVLPRPASAYVGRLDGWAVGDGDGDGETDLLLLGEYGDDRHFYRNDGAGAFTDATATAGFGAFAGQENTAYWVDLEGDGDLDLYLARGSLSGSLPLNDQLYSNDGFGRFVPRQLAVGDVAIEKTVVWGDFDGDGDPDAVIPGYYPFEARFYRNEGGMLVDATATSGLRVATSEVNAGLAVDLDRDGDLDLVLAGERLEIHRNDDLGQGGALVEAGSVASGLTDARAIFCRVGDLDHDGLPELLVHWRSIDEVSTLLLSQPANGGEGTIEYAKVNAASNLLVSLGPLDDAVLADLDGDGDLDPLLTGPRGTVLLEGRRNDRRWLRVRLHGHRGSVLGAAVRVRAVRVRAPRAEPGPLLAHIHAAIDSGGLGEIHTGLGDVATVDVEVLFPAPSHRRVVLRNVAAGSVLDVHDTAMPWRLPVRVSRAARRWLAAPGSRRDAFVLFVGLGAVLASLRHLARRRRSARHCGPYRLGPVLGEGAMGVVHRARHVVRGHEVALKLLHPHLLRDETHRLRFLREAQLMAECRHPALVQIEEAGEIDGRGFIAMELLKGRSLAHHLEAEGALPAPTWRAVATALTEALSALHEGGIVHRDLKSENVFLLDEPADDWTRRVRLMDLGLAWSEAQATLTREHVVVGTVSTMAPERLEGAPADARADLWSLGVVLYEAATGQLPFAAADGAALVQAILNEEPVPPSQRGAKLPAADEALILALLARDPAARPVLQPSSVSSPPVSESPSSTPDGPWLALYAAVQEHLEAGRLREADIALVACLQVVRTHIAQLDAERQVAYLARPDVCSLLELSRHLEQRLSESDPRV